MRIVAAFFRWLLILAVAVLAVSFAVNNRATVTLSLFPLPYEATLPLFFITVIAIMLGALLGGAAISVRNLRIRRDCAKLRRRLAAVENELAGMKLERPRDTA